MQHNAKRRSYQEIHMARDTYAASGCNRSSTPVRKAGHVSSKPSSSAAHGNDQWDTRKVGSRPVTPRLPAPPDPAAPMCDTAHFGANSDQADTPDDYEIMEFLEGLLEGFKSVHAAAKVSMHEKGPVPGEDVVDDWSQLDRLGKLPHSSRTVPLEERSCGQVPIMLVGQRGGPAAMMPPRTASAGSTPLRSNEDAVDTSSHADMFSTRMRLHALKAFLEETCGTVANSFDVMAGLALRASFGGSGNPNDRIRHMFTEEELCGTLSDLGYGVGAAPAWWHALFCSLDIDGDGAIALQDMYDALVLNLPTISDAIDQPEVFFTNPSEETWRRKTVFSG